jgi:hypothetical protein
MKTRMGHEIDVNDEKQLKDMKLNDSIQIPLTGYYIALTITRVMHGWNYTYIDKRNNSGGMHTVFISE